VPVAAAQQPELSGTVGALVGERNADQCGEVGDVRAFTRLPGNTVRTGVGIPACLCLG
jgi:hypothetical protein